MPATARALRPLAAALALTAAGAATAWTPSMANDGPSTTARADGPARSATGRHGPRPAGSGALAVRLDAAAHGTSGRLQVRIVEAGSLVALPLDWDGPRPVGVRYQWRPAFDTDGSGTGGALDGEDRAVVPSEPGVYELELTDGAARRAFSGEFRLLVRVPFGEKHGGYVGRYFMGVWPTEGKGRTDRYAPPSGFIRVTPGNEGLRLSDHFTLGEFLTHDQGGEWPKYVALEERLLEKLELVLERLDESGVPASHMVVMSGFRTPQYNRKGLSNGRAVLSRHQYGDAADVWVDNDGDWYMDDLNGDGRRDIADARVILRAVERVEARHPELVGGAGVYHDNGAHGPFIHIDVRGRRARW